MKRLLYLLPILFGLAAVASIPAADPPDAPPAPVHHPRGYKPLLAEQAKALHDAAFKRHGYLMAWLAKRATPPAVFDAVTQGWVQPIVDQGQCGDCYGVSASDAVTGSFIKAGWGKNDGSFKLSDQYGLDCGMYEGGCNGGDEAQVIDAYKSKGGPAEHYVDASGKAVSDYGPYTANPGSCKLKAGAKLWQVQDWGYVAGDQGQGPASLAAYKAALMQYGQLSIALDASSFDNYNSGVITNLGNSIDHAITCVGWDDTKQALHCRNNWGTSWGEQGYCWISYKAVPQIVEPIWILAPAVTPPPVPPPPGPTPPPTPSGNLYTMTTDPTTGVISFTPTTTPTPAGSVTLTPDQVKQLQQWLGGQNKEAPLPPPEQKKPAKPMPPPEPPESLEWRRPRDPSITNAAELWSPTALRGEWITHPGVYLPRRGDGWGEASEPPIPPPDSRWDHNHSYVWQTPGGRIPVSELRP